MVPYTEESKAKVISAEDYYRLCEDYVSLWFILRKKYPNFHLEFKDVLLKDILCNPPFNLPRNFVATTCCLLGRTLAIKEDGGIYACPRMRLPIGNIYNLKNKKDVAKIFSSS